MASQGLPFKCRRHALYNASCPYCRNSTGTPIVDSSIDIAPAKPAEPNIDDAWPSLAGLQPLYDRVIVIPLEHGEMTSTGLVVPETVRDSYPFGVGRVVAVGAGRIAHSSGGLVPLLCQVGEVVVYDKKAGFHLPWEGDTEAVCLREPEILGGYPVQVT